LPAPAAEDTVIPVLEGLDLIVPTSLDEALMILARDTGARPFAGGTDLMVLLEAGHLPPGRYVNLWGFRELRGIESTDTGIRIGALTTFSDVRTSTVVAESWPMLVTAASETGGVATQNRGTIGGNIANASPAADTPPALLVYDADIELQSSRGTRRVPYAGFHTGYKKTLAQAGEIIAALHLPRRSGWHTAYRKVGTRRAQAISKICFAGALRFDGPLVAEARLALGSVAPTVVRCARAEQTLVGRPIQEGTVAAATAALLDDISPIDDIRSTAEYRRRVAQNVLADYLRALIS
jgi:CO/xanthine dehydrogenase FAD-binding subunit